MRLRRTFAIGLLTAIVILLAAAFHPWQNDDTATQATSNRTPTTAATATPSRPTGSATTSSDAGTQDGSSTPDPAGTAVPAKGNGRLTSVVIPGAASTASGREVTFSVEIEGGLGVDSAAVATTVRSILLDDQGWQKKDGVRLVALQPADLKAGRHVDIRVTLASPSLTDKLCAPLRTLSQVSCWNGERSVLNLRRWMLGDDSYGTDIARYRIYQVNHEFGHGLGHGHASCPGARKRAPVMMQQTLTLGSCKPWPFPIGA